MTYKRAEHRNFHFTYKVTCTYNGRIFYGIHSDDVLDDSFMGHGTLLNRSKNEYGLEMHKFERLQIYQSRKEAKEAYNDLKASELINPINPKNHLYHFVYKTTRFDGKYYIGVHSTNNMNDGYKGSGIHIVRSLKKHGIDKHECKPLEFFNTRDEAFIRESEIVTPKLLNDPLCMNRAVGGNNHGNRVYGITEETRKKLSEKSKAAVRTDEWKKRISAANKGKVISREAIERHRAKMTGYKWKPEQVEARKSGQLSSEKFKQRYRPFKINGVVYQNGREACEAIGIPGGTLANRLRSPNWLEYQYLDSPKDPSKAGKRNKSRNAVYDQLARPTVFHEHMMIKSSAADKISQKIEIQRITITNVRIERKKRESSPNERPVSIEGVVYKSAAEAARILGISDRTVTSRCRRDLLKDWKYADVDDKQIRGPRKHPKAKPLMIDGIRYERVMDAEAALGCYRHTIKKRCESNKFPTWYYAD